MKVDEQVQALIDKVSNGQLDQYANQIRDSDFGFYIPAYADGDTIKVLSDDLSQVESNLAISVGPRTGALDPAEMQTVGWIGDPLGSGPIDVRVAV